MQLMYMSRLITSVALLAAVGACNSDRLTESRDEKDQNSKLITTLFISAPSSVNPLGQLQSATARSSGDQTFTYVSASPGGVPGVSVSITNRTRARLTSATPKVDVTVEDGGFDPVPIAASAGDTLAIEFLSADRSALLVGAAVVPSMRAPTIVRTNPRPGNNLPLNARFQIVFTEPVDPATTTSENIQVLARGARVGGSLVRTSDFSVAFIPAEPLRAKTSFQIVVSRGVRNLGGIALESEFSVNFETEAAPNPPTGTGSLFISGVMSPQHQGIRVTRGGAPVSDALVSVNGVRIAYCCGDLYSSDLPDAVPAGGTLNVKVESNGVTYEATGEVIPRPVITAPNPGSTFASTDSITLEWSTPTDPDSFSVCLNCWENSLYGAMYPTSGSARDFKIPARELVDIPEGAVVAVYAYKNNFLKSVGVQEVSSNVLFFARSSDARVLVKH